MSNKLNNTVTIALCLTITICGGCSKKITASSSSETIADMSISSSFETETSPTATSTSTEMLVETTIEESSAQTEEPPLTTTTSENTTVTTKLSTANETTVVTTSESIVTTEEIESQNDPPISETEISDEDLIEENPYPKPAYYRAESKSEYVHADRVGTPSLGANEKMTIKVTTSPSTMTSDDFYVGAESDELRVNCIREVPNEEKNTVTIYYDITSTVAGTYEVGIISLYDLYDYYYITEEELEAPIIKLRFLPLPEGQTVYIAQYSGTKYHFDPDCGGPNVDTTTLLDAEALGYEPCSKCVY